MAHQFESGNRTTIPLNHAERLSKLESFCAFQERCIWDVRQKMIQWDVDQEEQEQLIAALIENRFLNEERFAKAYAGGKFRIKKWGWRKIKFELIKRDISAYCLKQAHQEIDPTAYRTVLLEMLTAKNKSLKNKSALQRKALLVSFAVARGYEADLAVDLIKDF